MLANFASIANVRNGKAKRLACKEQGCNSVVEGKGMCVMHYTRDYRARVRSDPNYQPRKPQPHRAGMRRGLLTVIGLDHREKGANFWLCRCDCGTVKTVRGTSLFRTKKSCVSCGGCIGKHGHTGTPTYKTWTQMRSRCYSKSNPDYKHYGGRGITICERWKSFAAFLEDMGERPEGLSIDRINNNGNYEPGNCRWATQEEQVSNTRRNIVLQHNGETRIAKEWAKVLGINYGTIKGRIQSGRPTEEVLSCQKLSRR